MMNFYITIKIIFVSILNFSGLKSSKLIIFEEVSRNVLSIFNSLTLFILYVLQTKL